jgi:hypothetical protein
VVLTTTAFVHLTQQMADAFHLPDARIVVVQHPIGGIEEAAVIERARSIVEDVLALWTT